MFIREVKTLLKKANNVISELRCTLQEVFGDVFTVDHNKIYSNFQTNAIEKKLTVSLKKRH
jgi:hypothetical protein